MTPRAFRTAFAVAACALFAASVFVPVASADHDNDNVDDYTEDAACRDEDFAAVLATDPAQEAVDLARHYNLDQEALANEGLRILVALAQPIGGTNWYPIYLTPEEFRTQYSDLGARCSWDNGRGDLEIYGPALGSGVEGQEGALDVDGPQTPAEEIGQRLDAVALNGCDAIDNYVWTRPCTQPLEVLRGGEFESPVGVREISQPVPFLAPAFDGCTPVVTIYCFETPDPETPVAYLDLEDSSVKWESVFVPALCDAYTNTLCIDHSLFQEITGGGYIPSYGFSDSLVVVGYGDTVVQAGAPVEWGSRPVTVGGDLTGIHTLCATPCPSPQAYLIAESGYAVDSTTGPGDDRATLGGPIGGRVGYDEDGAGVTPSPG